MKSLGIAAVVCGFVVAASAAQDAGTNLLGKWNILGKDNTVIQSDGIVACECKTEKEISGVQQNIELNQTEPRTIEFSAESKAENASGETTGYDYGIYLDITHPDGTKTYGVVVPFKTGAHDWEKASFSYTPAKPIASVSYLTLFRNKTGKVWFRNAVLGVVGK
jgi:hypothetical protein